MQDYSGVWILAEQRHGTVQTISYELLTRGRALADTLGVPLAAVILGPTDDAGLDELIRRGADRVIIADAPELAEFLPEPYTRTMAHLVKTHQPEIIIAGATSSGRTLMPLLAITCHAGLTADCTGLDIEDETGNLLQTRPAIGGNIMATIKSPAHRPQMATVRPKSTRPAPADPARTGALIRETIDPELLKSRVKRLGFTPADADAANIQEAEVVVAGGRGLKKGDNFGLINALAALLGGAVGASRDAVDRGWIGYPHQVGLSGKTVSPKLYLCAGVSGSIQHLAGIKTSENIIAVNSNPEAQIFQVANYGIVGDLFEVLPLLIDKIKAKQAATAATV
ncbi:MAG: electron transfer flavoprotein subunit alpha/FixB family protein [Deltaproteobacteria bacterium]|nr:electron transfer flavoprotein subunit alpha/FixB family protein [Candidatus Anaeroferrophillacea bacterium]